METGRKITEPSWVCTQSSAYFMAASLVFCGTPSSGRGHVSASFACSWDSLPPILCLVQPQYGGFCLVYCILFCPVCSCLLEACSFLKRRQGGYGGQSRWRGLERMQGGEIVGIVGMCWQEKNVISIFFKKKSKIKKKFSKNKSFWRTVLYHGCHRQSCLKFKCIGQKNKVWRVQEYNGTEFKLYKQGYSHLKRKIKCKIQTMNSFFEGSFLLMIQKYKLKHTILLKSK